MLAVIVVLCMLPMNRVQDGVTFYYEREKFSYGQENGAIGSEIREIPGRNPELSYLLALYLQGPIEENLVPLFPEGTEILDLDIRARTLYIRLSDLKKDMTASEYSMACACLTMTCLGLTNVDNVSITSSDRTMFMNSKNLIFYDYSSSVDLPEAEETK